MSGPATPQARGPSYDANHEFHAGIDALDAGKYRLAKEDFEHVLVMVPDQPLALSFLGQAEMNLGDLKGAARDFEASMKRDPNQVVPARDLAIADEKLGRHDKAVSELIKLKGRAQACGGCDQAGDLDAAVRDVEAAMAAKPAG
jgi:tetratricopeptide (TPR) repeat protein